MNFNFNSQPEYQLNSSLTNEMINMYGVLVKFLMTEKINKDDNVFGDYSHIKTDNNKIFEMYMLPEVSEDWDTSDMSFNQFGLTNFDNISLFVTKASLDPVPDLIDDPLNLIGNLVVFPNNKIMEITASEWTVPGVNNLFTHDDEKSVIKISCKPYDFKLINELDNVDIDYDNDTDVPYETLDTYFQELIEQSAEQDIEAEVTEQVTTVEKTGGLDNKTVKPIVDKSEDDVWGAF